MCALGTWLNLPDYFDHARYGRTACLCVNLVPSVLNLVDLDVFEESFDLRE